MLEHKTKAQKSTDRDKDFWALVLVSNTSVIIKKDGALQLPSAFVL
jgi:hypothetical protein